MDHAIVPHRWSVVLPARSVMSMPWSGPATQELRSQLGGSGRSWAHMAAAPFAAVTMPTEPGWGMADLYDALSKAIEVSFTFERMWGHA